MKKGVLLLSTIFTLWGTSELDRFHELIGKIQSIKTAPPPIPVHADPMVRPKTLSKGFTLPFVEANVTVVTPPVELVLQAIIGNRVKINGLWAKVGERVEGWEVIKIEPLYVTVVQEKTTKVLSTRRENGKIQFMGR